MTQQWVVSEMFIPTSHLAQYQRNETSHAETRHDAIKRKIPQHKKMGKKLKTGLVALYISPKK